uniref:Uncharacterized protein LOC104247808 n=1 Tax=Nicotiana sylvestris TaxID=4096 RepID=A0A1U7YTT8_NICSY|nr:PREDICTED: uncharacterized protein LOC104247808 [Nicotiana sylvestris]
MHKLCIQRIAAKDVSKLNRGKLELHMKIVTTCLFSLHERESQSQIEDSNSKFRLKEVEFSEIRDSQFFDRSKNGRNEVTLLEHNHPLFLQASDAPNLVQVPIKLTGPKNYALWSRAMKLALRGKGKLEFVDESCVKSTYRGELAEQWEKCNAIVLSCIGSTVVGELMPSIVFASNAKKVWSDFKEKFDRCSLTRIYRLWTEIASLKQDTDTVTSYYTKMYDLWSELDVLVSTSACDCEEFRPSLEHLAQQRLLQCP